MSQVSPPIVHNAQSTSAIKIVYSLWAGQRPPSFVPPTHRPAVRRRAAGTALIALTALPMTACTDPPPTMTPSAAPSIVAPTQSPLTPSADPKTEALNAYSGMWKAYARAGLTANPDEPELAAHTANPALKMLRDALAEYREKKQVFKGEYGSRPTVVETSPKEKPVAAVIADCLDTTKFLVYKATGELADEEPGGRRSIGATVRLVNGTWKVVSFGAREKGTC